MLQGFKKKRPIDLVYDIEDEEIDMVTPDEDKPEMHLTFSFTELPLLLKNSPKIAFGSM